MDWLREWLPTASFGGRHARNFERDGGQGAGTRIIDQKSTATGQRLTIRLAPDSSMDHDLLQLVNRSTVEITDIFTEDGSAYLKIKIA